MSGGVGLAQHEAAPAAADTSRRTWVRRGPAELLSAHDVVVRGMTSLALLWQGLWIAADPTLWPTRQSGVLLALAVAMPALTWLVMLAAHLGSRARVRAWSRVADVAALFVATVAMLYSIAGSPSPDWSPAANLAVLAAGLPGLLFGIRQAMTWVAAVVLAETLAIVALPVVSDGASFTAASLLYPGNALAFGVVTMSAGFILKRDSGRADAAAAAVVDAEAQRLTAVGVASAVRRQERLLHETVLNTLTAIERGGLTSSPDVRARLVTRCRESARVLRELREQSDRRLQADAGSQDLEQDLSDPLADLFASGVSVHVACDRLDQVPSQVYSALRTAVREALSNVIRHAEAQAVWLTVRNETDDGVRRVQVEVRDDGIGFESEAVAPRFGLGAAIGGTLAEVGGTATVESGHLVGTTVRLEWASSTPMGVEPRFRPSAAGFALPVLGVFGMYTGATVAITWSDWARPMYSLLAFGIFVALAALVCWSSLRGPLPWWVVLVVSGVSPLIYQVQQLAQTQPNGVHWADWASSAIAALFLVVAGTGPPWGWLAVVCTWLFIQGDVLGELVSPGTAIILAGALFGRSTRANSEASERSRADQLAQQTALAVARESVHRLQRRYGALRESRAIDLLERIAQGSADPDSPEVQALAALEERYIRTVIRVDPALDAVHALATSLAVRAHRRGVFLEVDLAGSTTARSTDLTGCRSSLTRAVECSLPGEAARLTARTEGTSLVIRLLAPIARGDRGEMLRLAVPGVVIDPLDPDDAGMLWEVRRPSAVTP